MRRDPKAIMSDRCCVCFQDYSEDEGVECIQCQCTWWLHEDCVSSIAMEKNCSVLIVVPNVFDSHFTAHMIN